MGSSCHSEDEMQLRELGGHSVFWKICIDHTNASPCASHLLQKLLGHKQEIRGDMLKVEYCELLTVISHLKC